MCLSSSWGSQIRPQWRRTLPMGPGGKSMIFDKFYQVPDRAISTQEECCSTHLGRSNLPHDPGGVGVPQRGS